MKMYTSISIVSALAASVYAAPLQSLRLSPRVDKVQYNGDGSAGAGWPTIDQWQSLDSLWNINVPLIAQSCGNNGWGANDSESEQDDIRAAIDNISAANNLDARFVLAIMMEESHGCVRVITTGCSGGVCNPGLLQSHNGPGTCVGVDPCPTSEINQMITDGVAGTNVNGVEGDGLVQTVAASGESGAQGYYAGARKYNSGSVNLQDLGQAFGANTEYASNIANRLMGYAD